VMYVFFPHSFSCFELIFSLLSLPSSPSLPSHSRLQRTLPDQLPDPVSLPGDLHLLEQSYKIAPREHYVPLSKRWDTGWAKLPVASNLRDDAVAAAPFAKAEGHGEEVKGLVAGREKEKTAAALKVRCLSSSFSSSPR
jgi:hypothetical protein